MRESKITRAGLALGLAVLLLAGCGASGGDEPDATTTTTKAKATTTSTTAVTTTTAAVTTTTAAVTTTAPAPTTTAAPATTEPSNALSPGAACSMEEGSPDCIDPDGDGEGTYLIGGAACIASAPDPALCSDLDGDGYAGYPDSQ